MAGDIHAAIMHVRPEEVNSFFSVLGTNRDRFTAPWLAHGFLSPQSSHTSPASHFAKECGY